MLSGTGRVWSRPALPQPLILQKGRMMTSPCWIRCSEDAGKSVASNLAEAHLLARGHSHAKPHMFFSQHHVHHNQFAGTPKPRRTRKKAVPVPEADSVVATSTSSAADVTAARLRHTSDSLRALLQRRAERQKRDMTVAPPTSHSPAVPYIPAEMPAQRRAVKVCFWLNFHVDYGQSIRLVGGAPELGSWILSDGVPLAWSEGDMWNATVELPAGGVTEYKFVVVGGSGHAVAWQQGNNSVLALRHGEDSVDVYDNWYGSPGAQVVAGGAAPVTRENRLLSWASEVEAQIASQRQELRRVRMELVAAQEEAKAAREEAQRLKGALARSEAERCTAVANLKQAETVNYLLQTQLTETTTSFRQALEVAVDLLRPSSTKASRRRTEDGQFASKDAKEDGPAWVSAVGSKERQI